MTGQEYYWVVMNGLLELTTMKAQVKCICASLSNCLSHHPALTLWRPSSLIQMLRNKVLKTLERVKAKKRTVLSCKRWAISSKMAAASPVTSSDVTPFSLETSKIQNKSITNKDMLKQIILFFLNVFKFLTMRMQDDFCPSWSIFLVYKLERKLWTLSICSSPWLWSFYCMK